MADSESKSDDECTPKITINVKTPSSKEAIEVAENANIKEVSNLVLFKCNLKVSSFLTVLLGPCRYILQHLQDCRTFAKLKHIEK